MSQTRAPKAVHGKPSPVRAPNFTTRLWLPERPNRSQTADQAKFDFGASARLPNQAVARMVVEVSLQY
jgi:hypothetical protein